MERNTPVFGGQGLSNRGQSGMIGFVIVVALVLTGAVLVVFTGSAAINDLQQERTDAEAALVMEEVDSQLTTISSSDQSAVGRFSMADLDRQQSRVVRRGYLNVTVNKRNTCRTNTTLSSIRYESDDGETVAYQAGGVFVANDNGSAVQTPPDFQFRNGSLDITVANVTGEVSNTRNEAFYNATSSTRESARRSRTVISGSCTRPNNVTIHVQSDFYRAWGSYLHEELNTTRNGTKVRVYDANETAYAYINQSRLPRRVDDSRNNVVNLSTSPMADYMEDVDTSGNSIEINKTGSNQYAVYVEPMADGRAAGIGRVQRNSTSQNVSGAPLDVVFVLDESGSMGDPADTDCTTNCQTKREAAIEAAQNFTGQLNSSKDRVGLIGFSQYADGRARFYQINGQFLTRDFAEFNDTVTNIEARGGTYMWAGLRDANRLQDFKSNQTRERVIILLSDGRNNPELINHEINGSEYQANKTTKIFARDSRDMGATVHTIGFGTRSYLNEDLLQYVNQTTGGQYYFADNASELNDAFSDIATRESTSKFVALTPTSTNLTSENGAVFPPQIPGDIGDVAANTSDGNRFLNVNDPTAPDQFSHAFALSDEEAITFNATIYNCGEDGWRDTGRTENFNGTAYPVARCTNITSTERTLRDDEVEIYTDGDKITSLVEDDESGFWQDNVSEAIDSRRDVDTVVDGGETYIEMKSNQAMVVLDYPDSTNSTNRVALLYQIGRAESEAKGDGVINIRIRNIRVKP